MSKMKIYRVDVQVEEGDFSDEITIAHFVRHTNARSAQAWVLENRVSSRVATQGDIVEMVTGSYPILGLAEEESETLDLPGL
jgi:hypothetical protein